MPRGNGTGPNGSGPKTGRGAGYCAGNGLPGYASSNFGRGIGRGAGFGQGRGFGFGRGRGAGLGFRAGPAVPVVPAQAAPLDADRTADLERWNLERQAEALEEELELVRARLESIAPAPERPKGEALEQ